jgi:hypothetical protein
MKKQLMQMPVVVLSWMVLVSAFQFAGCSGAVQLASAWKQTDMVIDGNQNDWQGDLYSLKKANVTIGIRNDDKNLYLCFSSNDMNVQRQVLNGGFTVWFDPAGGMDEIYGIQFPVGYSKGEGRPVRGENSTDSYNGDNAILPAQGNDNAIVNGSQSEIKFLGPNKNDVQLSTMIELKTMKVQVGITRQLFVYELQVPLHRTEDFPFSLAPSGAKNVLGIEFKTSSVNSSEHAGEHSGSGMGESSGGGNGSEESEGSRRMGRHGRGGNEAHSTDPIELWTKVMLAQK